MPISPVQLAPHSTSAKVPQRLTRRHTAPDLAFSGRATNKVASKAANKAMHTLEELLSPKLKQLSDLLADIMTSTIDWFSTRLKHVSESYLKQFSAQVESVLPKAPQ